MTFKIGKKMNKTLLSLLSLLLCTQLSNAALLWGNSSPILDFTGSPVPASNDSSIGFFAQLIYAGTNSVADAFDHDLTSNGVTSDDVVVSTAHAGQGVAAFLVQDGIFPLATGVSGGSENNGTYYVRVFDAPNDNFGLGTFAPIVGSYYWQSSTHSYEYSATTDDQWNFAPSGGQTTITIIPEPSVIAIMGLGLFGLASARRRLQA
ncbi:MAG: PEP-CTERM sorting domain-containing protein [Kiritimatiellia bacterium]